MRPLPSPLPARQAVSPAVFVPLAAAVSLAGILAACGQLPWQGECTLVGCEGSLVVDLDGDLEDGAWRVEIEADGVAEACDFILPADPEDPAPCPGDLQIIVGVFEPPAVRLILPTAEEVRREDLPAAYSVTLIHGGAVRATETLAVEYRTVQPNGPRCPPTCFGAEATLSF